MAIYSIAIGDVNTESDEFYGRVSVRERKEPHMHGTKDRLDTLKGMMDRTIEKSPHSREILNAFRPVILERHRLMENLDWEPVDPAAIDREKLKKGIPVIRQVELLRRSDPWREIALALLPAFKQGFTDLRNDWDALQDFIRSGSLDYDGYFNASSGNADNIPEYFSGEAKIRPAASRLFLRTLTWIVLHRRTRGMAASIGEADWNRGTCPICGSFPSISVIREKTAQRWLHCFQCGWDWRFSRVICPYCAHEGPAGMTFYFVEDRKQESVFICDQCNRYLLTLNQVSDLHEMDLDIAAIVLAHLDILMQTKGLAPMVPVEWSPS